jgi:hypothetical protein
MEGNIKVFGKMVSNMEKGNFSTMIKKVGKKEYGMKVKGLIGLIIKMNKL